MIAPKIFQFFEKIANPNSICKGIPIYELYGKISGRAYSGKLVAIIDYLYHFHLEASNQPA